MSDPAAVIHVLSAREEGSDAARLRATIRSGDPQTGDTLWFADAEGTRHEVELAACDDAARGHKEILVRGAGAGEIRGGTYLYAVD